MNPIKSEADLDRMRRTTQAHMMISAWSSAGLFEALSDGEMRPLSSLPGNSRALHIGATILGHVGLLQTDGVLWGLSPIGVELFAEGALSMSPHEPFCQDLGVLPEVLKSGGTIQDTDIGVVEDEPERVRGFMKYLYRRSEIPAAHAAQWMAQWLAPGQRVLDLGGGHGRYAAAFSKVGLEATLFDKKVCVEIAADLCDAPIQVRSGDFHADDLGGPYDAVFLSNIVHGLGADEIADLLNRIGDVLAPGGRVVVKDFFAQGNGLQPEGAVMFGMVMLMFTKSGRTYTVAEMQDMLALAGLAPDGVVESPELGYELIVGRRLA